MTRNSGKKSELKVRDPRTPYKFLTVQIRDSKIGLIGVETPADRGGWGGDFLSNIVGMEEQIYNMVPGGALRTTVKVL